MKLGFWRKRKLRYSQNITTLSIKNQVGNSILALTMPSPLPRICRKRRGHCEREKRADDEKDNNPRTEINNTNAAINAKHGR